MAANPSNLPVVFNFGKQSIRTIDKEGEVWFVVNDVATALELSNPRQAVSRLDDDERDAVTLNDAMGRAQEVTTISESGLYSLVMSSRKAEAKQFKRWVTHEVLPAIRKTGAYQGQAEATQKPVPEQRHPLHKFTAEQINERIDRRAMQLSLIMSRKFVADMRKPSQFHYFQTGDNSPEGWLPNFGSGAAIDALRMVVHMAGEARKRALKDDAEWEALMDESLKANGLMRVRKEFEE